MQEFLELAEKGKFHQLTQSLLERIKESPEKEMRSVYNSIVLSNYYNLHQESFAEISCALSEKYQSDNALVLLEEALNVLCSSKEGDSPIERGMLLAKENNPAAIRLLLEIAYRLVLLDKISQAKIILYDCKELQIESKNSIRKLHLSMGLLHFSTKNFFPSFKNLLEYLEISDPNNELFTKCLIAGILSEKIYSFAKLIFLWKGEETPSFLLAKALEEGKVEESIKLCKHNQPDLTEKVEKKAILIQLLNYFFSNQQRKVSLPELSNLLSIPLSTLENTILDILGSSFMKGTIDQITGVFSYSWIGHKHLTKQEMLSVREIISELKNRVESVIQSTQTK
ncbi:26S proteasome regulatory subunit N9 [Nematocida sp. LUAm3]|nr:26S proteasome regulatory subunit N9 [Nematocida sp. LUAm3]KAI5176168.1 26S proteasome regulatory subunit N9 [Nematocida sp. LUAm2]KAI5179262.1 26S proteasome regulatory subunit N9 [Nematocida sp. LUAm1]